MASVSLKQLRKSYDGKHDILAGIDLEIAHGEFVVLVGPSGCGKSTLLRMLCGLESISGGDMQIGGRTVNHFPPAERGIAMVFQSYALYPHMTVYQNMAFGLKVAGKDKATIKQRITEAAAILKIDHLLERFPRELSGGQRQRVAIGRAIVREPQLFLFDEPLSNLDAALRVQTRLEIAKLHRQLDATIVYVTHDQVEAMTLGDKIVVMHEGHIQQAGTPLDLYQQPCNLFVAGFIGSPKMNFLAGGVVDAHPNGISVLLKSGETVRAAVDGSGLKAGDKVTLGLRAEHISESRSGSEVFTGEVSVVEHLGEANYIYVSREGREDVVIRGDGERHVAPGQEIVFSADSTAFHVFDEKGEARRRLRPGNMVSATRGMMRSA
ncbi:sn-glycerol-3-phosphate ABC transporter ATP-binding protein UgpC [Pseudoduganella sp. FT55W]|uniref:Sn-glycerol-3-phosphate ABC transporter ATP-binding protein UgpC n=1 Tax=Duganella rivi TaxID=2666083 RepID=A0A7X4GN03_9BURK|nr:sn-glycerol-3-phosphate ABC transporter ATP-binding protein UgpC [Duganella rivi]MYM66446.1 sn-glycerol-3-phosphate ABC transporter ATP-binding protein UgpC [Duganella rivi]